MEGVTQEAISPTHLEKHHTIYILCLTEHPKVIPLLCSQGVIIYPVCQSELGGCSPCKSRAPALCPFQRFSESSCTLLASESLSKKYTQEATCWNHSQLPGGHIRPPTWPWDPGYGSMVCLCEMAGNNSHRTGILWRCHQPAAGSGTGPSSLGTQGDSCLPGSGPTWEAK